MIQVHVGIENVSSLCARPEVVCRSFVKQKRESKFPCEKMALLIIAPNFAIGAHKGSNFEMQLKWVIKTGKQKTVPADVPIP